MKALPRGALVALLVLLALLAACHKGPQGPDAPIRLGFFSNVTHAQALVGNDEGTFREALGGKPLKTLQFNAGPAAMEGLLARAVDVCYVGAGPAITAYVRSGGELKVIAGAASGGSVLVARTVTAPAQLAGKRVAVPQLGNTQDITLRWWLSTQGLKPTSLGGNVMVLPQPNPEIMTLFRRGEIEAAWVPEPWASRLLAEGGHVLVDERTLWPGGRFPTTVLVATRDALEHRREEVKALLRAHLQLTARAHAQPQAFQAETNQAFGRLTGKTMSQSVVEQSFARMELTVDPMREQLATEAERSAQLGYIPNVDVSGMVDDSLLREVQQEEGVGGAGR